MSDNEKAARDKATRISNAQVVNRIDGLADRLEDMLENLDGDVRRIVNDELDKRLRLQQEQVDSSITDALKKFTAFADVISRDYAEHRERQRQIELNSQSVQLSAAKIEGALSTLIEQLKRTEARVDEIEDETESLQSAARDFEWRIGNAFTPIFGYNPASSDREKVSVGLIEAVADMKTTLTAVAADVSAMKARQALVRVWVTRVIRVLPSLSPLAKILAALGGGGALLILAELLSQIPQ